MLIGLDNGTVQISQSHIVPTVDIDFLDIGIGEVLGQNRVFRHLRKQSVRQFLIRITVYEIGVIKQELGNIRFQLRCLGTINECCGVIPDNIGLCVTHKSLKINLCHNHTNLSDTALTAAVYLRSFIGS